MSRGPGQIESAIGELFAASRTNVDSDDIASLRAAIAGLSGTRAFSVAEICDHAFALGGAPASRAQRLSATRAAHRLLRRVRDADTKSDRLVQEAHANTKAALGRERRVTTKAGIRDDEYQRRLEADPAWQAHEKFRAFCERIGVWGRFLPGDERGTIRIEHDYWCATETAKGLLYFHLPDVPVRVWAVSIQRAGAIWSDAEVFKITERNVIVDYAGERARLDRHKLWRWWAWWRGVQFVSSRTGRIAEHLDALWQERYGHASGGVPPVRQMPLAEATALLGVPVDYTRDDIIAAFRREAKKVHPDVGGTAEQFRRLVEARDRLLAALGTSAPAPKMPAYYPSGTRVVYRSGRRLGHTRSRIGHTRRLTG